MRGPIYANFDEVAQLLGGRTKYGHHGPPGCWSVGRTLA
jgi:hypothetical protein